ncbi:MAG TPA: hypothetical protein VHE34_09600 [Puia sp.]|uniref:hypothetical protein n=1 Tax=Puia sp. TaxID=2045100 RepID=UPI002B8222D3|nr:hypothetical protein [Puia sp.]HVU95469.1 hypothetical protein [Puia sp.]
MKRLSISLPAIALALVLILSGATTTHYAAAALNATSNHKEAGAINPTAASPAVHNDKAKFDTYYYWYTYPGDAYVDHESIAIEEFEYWFYYGWNVNTTPGGTLISKGYTLYGTPHSFPPSVFLYRH